MQSGTSGLSGQALKKAASSEPPRTPGDPSETYVLPEIIQGQNPFTQGKWLTAWILTVVLAAGGGFFLGRATVPAQQPVASEDTDTSYDDTVAPAARPSASNPATASAEQPPAHRRSYSHAGEAQGAAVIAAAKPASGMMYVHRMNSDLRDQPSYEAQVIKKEAKGAQVQLLALSDKWAKVKDGSLTGWMRASVLKDTPPGEKRKKKSDDGDN